MDRTCIIVAEIAAVDNKIASGIVVDSIAEVLNIRETEIEDTPSFGANLDTVYILGLAKISPTIKILLDIDRVLSGRDIQEIAGAA